jgi:hypothetical protein
MSKGGMAGHKAGPFLAFEEWPFDFHFTLHPQRVRIPLSPHPCQHFLVAVFLLMVDLMVVLIYIPFMAEHCFMSLLAISSSSSENSLVDSFLYGMICSFLFSFFELFVYSGY